MKKFLLLLCALSGCTGTIDGTDVGVGSGTGSGSGAGSGTGSGGGSGTGGDGQASACPIPATTPDTGALPALNADLCTLPGSMGAAHWYRVSAVLPGATVDDVQLELYDNYGPFVGGTVRTGTFSVDPDPETCGVCMRAVGDKGAAGAKEYFGRSGTVSIDALDGDGAVVTISLKGITLAEVDDMQAPVEGGCSAVVDAAEISGTLTQVGAADGTGDECPSGIGD